MSSECDKSESVIRDGIVEIKKLLEERNMDELYKLLRKIGPGKWNYSFDKMDTRYIFCRYISWAFPTIDLIKMIIDFIGTNQTLEIGSGRGLCAGILQVYNVNVIATDDFSWYTGKNNVDSEYYTQVENLSAISAVEKYSGASVLMLIWPPYGSSMASDALGKFAGDKLVYIGEDKDGCTGDGKFHLMLNKEWKLVGCDHASPWFGIHDYLYLYIRNKPSVKNSFS